MARAAGGGRGRGHSPRPELHRRRAAVETQGEKSGPRSARGWERGAPGRSAAPAPSCLGGRRDHAVRFPDAPRPPTAAGCGARRDPAGSQPGGSPRAPRGRRGQDGQLWVPRRADTGVRYRTAPRHPLPARALRTRPERDPPSPTRQRPGPGGACVPAVYLPDPALGAGARPTKAWEGGAAAARAFASSSFGPVRNKCVWGEWARLRVPGA